MIGHAELASRSLAAATSVRDLKILTLASGMLGRSRIDFRDAIDALHAAVVASIPNGRVFLLASTSASPVIGSLVSGVGLRDTPRGIQIVRVGPGGVIQPLGALVR